MIFIPPMLCEVLRDPTRLDDPRYAAEPKFDGQRAQVHIADGRTVAAFSRRNLDLLRHTGLAWLREVRWPVAQAVLDGELCGESGSDGIRAVLEARGRKDGVSSFLAFDVLQLEGKDVMPESWADRRKRLEDLEGALDSKRVAIVPVTEDASRLWALWVGQQGGEGIVLKERLAPYRPGRRSPAWLKVKERVVLEVMVEDGNPELVRWGDWGWAARVRLTYRHPRSGIRGTIDELVRIPDRDNFKLRRGARAHVLCWGILRPSGRLRHPVFVGWRSRT
jgi:bifunctional non-homologous end joining protein LigD